MKIATVALAPLLMAAAAPPSAIQVRLSAVDGGAVRAGTPLDIRVSARDPVTAYPLTAMTPALWLVPDDGEQENGRCERLVNRLAASAVPPEGTIDANGFDLIQATDDGRLALVDPLLNLASANIKAVLDLGGPPVAWAIDPAGASLAVAIAQDRSLAIVDVSRFAVAQRRILAAAPSAVVASGERFWVGAEDGTAALLDRAGEGVAPPVPIGRGAVRLAAAGDTTVALARSGEGAFLRAGAAPRRFVLGVEASELAYSSLADAAYALAASGDALFFVPQDRPEAFQRITLERSARALAASPDGRWLALVAADGSAVTVFDVAAGRARWTIAANDPVVAASFSDAFLYLAHRRQGGATRVVFDPAGGPPGTVTIAAGSSSDADNGIAALPVMARVPGAGMLVASARDRAAYMINDDNAQAAMSSLPLRAGRPAGVMLRYRGLVVARGGGEYAAQAVVPRGGRYLAVVRTDRPAMAHCMPVSLLPAPGETARTAAARAAPVERALVIRASLPPGPQALRFAISGPPVRMLGAMLIGDGWQFAPPDIVSEAGGGWRMPVDLPAGRGFTLFVRYGDAAGEMILSAPVQVDGR